MDVTATSPRHKINSTDCMTLKETILSSEDYFFLQQNVLKPGKMDSRTPQAPVQTPSPFRRFRNALDKSRSGLDKSRNSGGIFGGVFNNNDDALNKSQNGMDRSWNGVYSRNSASKKVANSAGLDRSLSGLSPEDEDKRIKRFGKHRSMWEQKGKQNTPNGIEIKRVVVKIKTVTPDDDRLPPSHTMASPGSDIIARKGFIGNTKFLKGVKKGDPRAEEEYFKHFPPPEAKEIVQKVIQKHKEITKIPFPTCVTFTLWATDNVNTYGRSLAQIFEFVGIRLVEGTIDEVELIPLEELQRPRIDVVVSCSGVFRDIFMNQMTLLDRGIKMAAEAKEAPDVNFVRRHSFQMTQELGCNIREAATRVFSNAAGSYSANISAWIDSNEWESETQLQRQFLARKCYAFNSDKPGMMEYKSEAFKAALRNSDVTLQNLDLNGISSITDVPHYYDSDPTKVIEALRFDGKRPLCLLAKTSAEGNEVHTLNETIRIDSMAKILSPDYYEKILRKNDDGVKEISNCLRNMLGWAVTSGNVDTFLFEIASSIFLDDKDMCSRLRGKDNTSFRNLLSTFVKAGEQGYWETSERKVIRLRELKKFAESGFD